jgi:hypothetical protein
MILLEKAYRVYSGHPDNGEIVHAESVGQAKARLTYIDNYVNLKAKRVKEEDLVDYGGKAITREYAELLIKRDARLERMRGLPEDEMYLVQDNRQYVGNSVLWWALGGSGYTTNIDNAQRYTKFEVIEQFGKGRESDIIWLESHVLKAVKRHVDVQGLDRDFSV